jgi:hypothetical protein
MISNLKEYIRKKVKHKRFKPKKPLFLGTLDLLEKQFFRIIFSFGALGRLT